MDYNDDGNYSCQQIARCIDGDVPYIGWVSIDDPWSYIRVVPKPDAHILELPQKPLTRVDERPYYDTTHIAPSADWTILETDVFRVGRV